MIYHRAGLARRAHKRVLVYGMSGLGKTHLSNMLRMAGAWFHYSIDYRIGTRYMGEYITDNAKAHAMKVPFLRDLLMSDSIYIGSNITFDNLEPVSAYLGKPGDPEKGGLPIEEFRRARNSSAAPRSRRFRTPPISSAGPRRSMAIRISSATPAARSANGSMATTPTTLC